MFRYSYGVVIKGWEGEGERERQRERDRERERERATYIQHHIIPLLINFIYTRTVKGVIERVKTLQLTINDFEILEIIGRGAFGEVKASLGDNSHTNSALILADKQIFSLSMAQYSSIVECFPCMCVC